MGALDNVSEWGEYKVPVKLTIEYETEITVTANNSDDIADKADEYISEYYDDMASEVMAMTGKSRLKDWEEHF
ncbi:hypothetical protein ISO99_06930 [Staphylococcus sp. 18_1_E_LY]|uniref:Uncharacterized protein n=1 Tax=Staphylococcus lloydii TaxID=2781774 RepID=A0A7T1AZM1_9STAP|nr:hypothetical protein [Staphylococcus lloydii]MBF7019645.1 hypothetical protein [Staphylococcus lloydii]MBF7027373.1 hypothetical protein [Staphylococcus lloydii]MDU9418992.1 hypothetical protein [Staphylococcus lloydii]QPM75035.1 hypothetical protein ISP08_12060 [Staphylococcus lloydii]